jgi:large subunit ribosomal protein L18
VGIEKKQRDRIKRRVFRVRNKQKDSPLPKVSVHRSLSNIYAQIIDKQAGKTLESFSSIQLTNATGTKKEIARAVGIELAKRAKAKGIEAVVFDRGQYLYHGRVKELSEGLREGGLKF